MILFFSVALPLDADYDDETMIIIIIIAIAKPNDILFVSFHFAGIECVSFDQSPLDSIEFRILLR